MKTLKQEEIKESSYRNLRQALRTITAFIQTVYQSSAAAFGFGLSLA